MKRTIVALLALAGVALAGATVIQIKGIEVRRLAGDTAGGLTPAARASAPLDSARWVAAEGRVVTYPGGEVAVSTERPGKLVALHVEENDEVEKGALLAEIDASELAASREEVRARIVEAKADLELARKMLVRREGLVVREAVAVQAFDEAQRDHDAARGRLAALEAEESLLSIQIGKCRILAPITGTVSRRVADAGEVLEAGDGLLTLMDLDHLRIQAESDEADAGSVALGARVEITSDAYPGRVFEGTVEEVPGWVEARSLKPVDPARPSDTRVLAIKVRFSDPNPLKVGTTVELRVASGSAS